MAREARETSKLSTYLIVLKTAELKIDDKGKEMLLETLSHYIRKTEGMLLAYHLSDDCFRFVIKSEQMSELMRSVSIRFVYSYNKYKMRKGEIFKDRFTSFGASSPEEGMQMIACLHYLRPTTSFCSKDDYNDNVYLQDKYGRPYMTMTPAKEEMLYHYAQQESTLTLMRKVAKKYSEEEMRTFVVQVLEGEEVSCVNEEKKKKLIKKLTSFYGASVRQIVKITGLPFRFVYQSMKKMVSSGEDHT